MDQESAYILVLQVMSIVSVVSSLLVILNLALVHYSANEGSQFDLSQIYQAIAFIALGNVIGNAGYLSESRPPTGSVGCSTEGFFQLLGYPSSWLWTLHLSFTVYSLVIAEKVPVNRLRSNIICWGLPFLLALFQFLVGGYGEHTKVETYDICSNRQSDRSSAIYHYTTFYGLFLVIVIALLLMRCKLYYLRWIEDARTLSPMVVVLQQSLEFYPALLLLCWVPHSIIYFIPSVSPGVHLFSLSIKIAHGTLLAIAYFYQSPPGRKVLWLMLTPSFWLSKKPASVHLSNLSTWSFSSHRPSVINELHRKTMAGRKTEASLQSDLLDADRESQNEVL